MPQAAESFERETPVQPSPSDNPSSPGPFEDRPWRRGFWSLIATQFQGAFSANAFRYLLTYMILGMALTRDREDKSIALIGLLFSVPFVLLNGFSGDRDLAFAEAVRQKTTSHAEQYKRHGEEQTNQCD